MSVIEATYVSLSNGETNYYLHGDNIQSGGDVRQNKPWPDGNNCQEWLAIMVGSIGDNGVFTFVNRDTGLVLHGDSKRGGGNARQYKAWDGYQPCQRWELVPTNNESTGFALKNLSTDEVLHAGKAEEMYASRSLGQVGIRASAGRLLRLVRRASLQFRSLQNRSLCPY